MLAESSVVPFFQRYVTPDFNLYSIVEPDPVTCSKSSSFEDLTVPDAESYT